MWKCVCGYVLGSVAHACPRCHRALRDNAKCAEQLQKILLALTLTPGTRANVAEVEREALAGLASSMPLSDISKHLDKIYNDSAKQFARILENLAG
jgi:hypothetical protein